MATQGHLTHGGEPAQAERVVGGERAGAGVGTGAATGSAARHLCQECGIECAWVSILNAATSCMENGLVLEHVAVPAAPLQLTTRIIPGCRPRLVQVQGFMVHDVCSKSRAPLANAAHLDLVVGDDSAAAQVKRGASAEVCDGPWSSPGVASYSPALAVWETPVSSAVTTLRPPLFGLHLQKPGSPMISGFLARMS